MCRCGLCRNCKQRSRRKLNPEFYRSKERASYPRRALAKAATASRWRSNNKVRAYEISRKRLAMVEAIKNKPCMDCHTMFPPECMDFDHRNPTDKVEGVGHMIACRWSWKKIEAEIAKCDLVCANCHRIRTKLRHRIKREAA